MNVLSISQLRDTVYNYSRSLGCAPADAEDLTQDVFVSLIERGLINSEDGASKEVSDLRRYACKMARNHFIDRRRRACALRRGGMAVDQSLDDDQSQGELAIDTVTPAELAERQEALEAWETCLSQLGKRAEAAGKGPLFSKASPFLVPGSRFQDPSGKSNRVRVQIWRWRKTLLSRVRASLESAEAA